MVVPIYKKWEASSARLQILKQDRVIQLVAFFQDFSHGDCMNFHLKGTDVFESFSKSGKHYIRIVDAKFALPKGEGASNTGFVCLDMPEYPGEHDDITIAFDSASGEALSNSFPSASACPQTKNIPQDPTLTRARLLQQTGINSKTPSPRTSLGHHHEYQPYESNSYLSCRRVARTLAPLSIIYPLSM
jgi:hypothetical protein